MSLEPLRHDQRRPILLVEDNGDDEELTLRSLRQCRVANEIVVARDGVEALDLLHGWGALPTLPQLVILDPKLPKIDGFGVLKRILEHPRTRTTPVVVLTSSAEDSDVLATYDFGGEQLRAQAGTTRGFCTRHRATRALLDVVNLGPET